jgi:hypothetical protein
MLGAAAVLPAAAIDPAYPTGALLAIIFRPGIKGPELVDSYPMDWPRRARTRRPACIA